MVNINDVYQRVLFLANKEQRGYITPDEFNSYAKQAQLEVFESYFIKKFQSIQAPDTNEDYANIDMNVDEKISFFERFGNVATRTALPGGRMGYAYPTDFYRLDHVSVLGPQGFPIKVDEISHENSHYVNLSPLTRPTATQPVMIREEGGVVVFPEMNFTGGLNFFYVRTPVDPLWAQRVGAQSDVDRLYPNGATPAQTAQIVGVPFYDEGNSVNFELHPSDEQELVYKILGFAGVTIKQPDITGFAQGKEGQLQQTEG